MKRKRMRVVLRQRQSTTLKLHFKMALLISTVTLLAAFFIFLLFGTVATPDQAKASTNETIDSGSFIINMGVVPQTKSNALIPYGMVYDLVKIYSTPVKWIINDSKSKDGADFTYNAIAYKGAPFIIPAAYITSTIKTRITYWLSKGVQGVYTTSSLSVPVYSTLTVMPTMTIDDTDGKEGIIIGYFDNALIPSTAYSTGPTSSLSSCHDLWINPHGDPTWTTHSRLYNFAIADGSFVFSQCHATSMMEGCKNTVSPFEQLNFLSTNGLKCYSSGKCGAAITETHAGSPTAPFSYNYPSDPIAQFMGTVSSALSGGSEDWYIPQSTGGWRATTRRIVSTADGTSPGEGTLMVYGPAYGLANAGWVMYESGHNFGGTGVEDVAAQRAFFNFMIFAASRKSVNFASDNIPTNFVDNSSTSVNISVTVGSGTPPYSYQWATSVAGATFGSPTSASTSFTLPANLGNATGLITVKVTDACLRQNFLSRPIRITPNTLPVSLLDFTVALNKNNSTVDLNWQTASEKNNDYFTIERASDDKHFTVLARIDGAGNSNVIKHYSFKDDRPLTGTSYYRLKQTDFNGDFVTFKMMPVYIAIKVFNPLQVFPNPFKNSFTVKFESDKSKNIQIALFKTNGAMVQIEKIKAVTGTNSYQFMIDENLPTGTYYIKVFDDNDALGISKIIKVFD